MIIEVDGSPKVQHPDFRWMTLSRLTDLLRFSHYLTVQLRTLVAPLRGLG
jgi:oxidase EvaA